MALDRTALRTIADRYASALFDLAKEAGVLSGVQEIFAGFVALLEENKSLRRAFANPSVSRNEKAAVAVAVAEKLGKNSLFVAFIRRLAENNRLPAVHEIYISFLRLVSKEEGSIRVEITTASALSKKDIEDIVARLETAAGKKIHVEHSVDPAILGGIKVRRGSLLLDCSVQGKLERLGLKLEHKITYG